MANRIQRRRTKGWRMPEGAVYVGSPSRWGNDFRVGFTGWLPIGGGKWDKSPHPPLTHEQAVDAFRRMLGPEDVERIRRELAGKDLACWCPLDAVCHADVLLELANRQADDDH